MVQNLYKIKIAILFFLLLITALWLSITPSGDRDWADDVARIVTGKVERDVVTLHNVRNFEWRTRDEYQQAWETREYDLSRLTSVDMFLSTWGRPDIAHTLVSFGFEDDEHVVFSVEIRKERHEKFSEIAGFFKQYEIALIAADENDIVRTRTNIRKEDVSIYRVHLSQEQARALFLSYVDRGNKLAAQPEFYNTLTANCTTVVYDMIKMIVPDLPMDYRILLSGRLPSYIYEIGGFGRDQTLAEIVADAPITARAQSIPDDEDFSAWIRSRHY